MNRLFDFKDRDVADPNDYPTPQWLFDQLDDEFHFTVDVAASKNNAKCDRYYTRDDDGLSHNWTGVVWMNPPYSPWTELARWVQKAFQSARDGATVVCLLPVRADTNWWHDYAIKGEVRWIRQRLNFGGTGRPSFASCIVIFRPA